jgi:hypothetical protein
VRHFGVIGLVGVLIVGARTIQAQDTVGLPVTGSLIYNAVVYNRVENGGGRGGAFRFAGRIAVRISPSTYVGFGAGSWVRDSRPSCDIYPDCEHLIAAQGEAVVYQGYVQHYVRNNVLFVRAGTGLARTTTLLSQFPFFEATRRWRAAVSVGTGVDLRIAELLYLTPSFDVTVLPGADTKAEELGTGFAFGLALTLR